MTDENHQEELTVASPEATEIFEESSNDGVIMPTADDRAEAPPEEERLIADADDKWLGEEIGAAIREETVFDEAVAFISAIPAGQTDDEINAMQEEIEPASDGVIELAVEDWTESLLEEERLIADADDKWLGDEIGAEIRDETVFDEAVAFISAIPAGQTNDEVNAMQEEIEPANDGVIELAAEDGTETLSEEERLTADDIELGEEIEGAKGEETASDEGVAFISGGRAWQTDDEINAMQEEIEPASDGVIELAAEDWTESLLEEERLIADADDKWLGDEIGAAIREETVLDEAVAFISAIPAGQTDDEINAMQEEIEPASDGVIELAAEDRTETLSEEERLIADDIELEEEIEGAIGVETASDEGVAFISAVPAGQTDDEINAMQEEIEPANDSVIELAAEDRTETLSEEERLIADDIELGEEIEGAIGEETASEDGVAFISAVHVGQTDNEINAMQEEIEPANDGVIELAAEDGTETLSEEERLVADDIELGEEIEGAVGEETASDEEVAIISVPASQSDDEITATREEIKPAIEALLFVAEEPLPYKTLCKLLGEVSEDDVRAALDELVADYEARNGGLEIREIAGGWRISTRPQSHDFIRKYLKSRPSARLSLPALETLAVIAYKQPITIPEILEIRGVTSSSAIKTLLEKRLIVTKGRKETVGRPMLYGTSKEFLIQFGLKDLTELPSMEDFEDLAQ